MKNNRRPTASPAARPAGDPLGRAYPFLLPVLLFFAVTAISRQFAVGFAVVCLVFAVGRTPMSLLRQRAGLLPLAVTAYSAVCLLSGLWSRFGAYAGRESIKILIALAAFGLVLCRTRRESLRGLLWSLNGVLAAVSLLCVDAGSWQLLSRGFSALMRLFHSSYPLDRMGYEAGIRITGIFSNANVSAGLIAFGLLISLYLCRTAGCWKERLAASLVMGTQALAFFLSFSMGAMGAFAVTCLVYVLCTEKGSRLELFLLMLESVVVTVLCAFACYSFLGTGSVLPVLLAPVCGGAIWALDRFVGRRLLSALEGRSRAVGVAGGVLAGLVVVYAVLAFNVTGGITLQADQSLSRAIDPAPGAYTVTAQGVDAHVRIYTQNDAQLMMHTDTTLYEGPLSQAAFTVPEDSSIVWFVLEGDGALSSLSLSDGTEVPLGYKLLPGFAANRLQGLWANQNFIQRLVFFRDGLKLFQDSPLLGWGVGGVEGQLTAVQDFYYESKYIHNHFIQIMDEAGVLGLGAFLLLLGSALWLLIRSRKQPRTPLFSMLAACLTMMIAHSLTEVVWSAQMYQVVVFVVLAVLTIAFQPEPQQKAVLRGRLLAAGLWGVVLVFGAFQAGSVWASSAFQPAEDQDMTVSQFVSHLQRLDRMEVYDDAPYQINAMANALQMDSVTGRGIAAGYAKKLEATGEFDNCYHVAAYYCLPTRDFQGFFRATGTGLAQEASNPDAWNSIAHLYAQAAQQLEPEELEEFLPGVAAYQEQLTAFNNSGRMEQIVLSAENQAFVDAACALQHADGAAAKAMLDALLP